MVGFKQVRACVIGELREIQDMWKRNWFCRNRTIKETKLAIQWGLF